MHLDYRQHGHGIAAERGTFTLEHEWTTWRAVLQAGASGYSTGLVRPTAAARVEWFPWVETLFGAGYEHYDLLDEVTTLRSVRPQPGDDGPRILQGDRAKLWLRWPLPWEVRLAAEASLASVTDGNRSDGAGLSLARRLWRRPRLDLALDVHTYGVAERNARYWSPRRYWTTGATVSVEQPLWWGLTVRAEGRGGYAEEDGAATPEVSYGVSLTSDPTCPWTVALSYRAGQSAREGGYGVNAVTASVTYRAGAETH